MCGTNAHPVLSTALTATSVPTADARLSISLLFSHAAGVLTTVPVAVAVTGRLRLVLLVAAIMVVSLFLFLTVTVGMGVTVEMEEAAAIARLVTAETEDPVAMVEMVATEAMVEMVATAVTGEMEEMATEAAILLSSSTRLLRPWAEASCRYSSRFPLPSLFYRLGNWGHILTHVGVRDGVLVFFSITSSIRKGVMGFA
jgi:hypothetical protein